MQDEYGHTWSSPGYNGYSSNQLVDLPRVTTETGWLTQGDNAISEVEQGKLFLNLYLAAYKRGWTYTFIYMLRDDPVQGYWGLFHTNYTPKVSGTYLHNLTTILADTGLHHAWLISMLHSQGASHPSIICFCKKSNRNFELAVWGEMVGGSRNVIVDLTVSNAIVNIYDPTTGPSPTQTLRNVDLVPLTMTDHPLILEFPSQ